MRRDEVQRLLDRNADELASLGVRSLHLFGSVARDASDAQSDVDLLVEFSRPTGIFGLVRLQQRLESILGVRVDLGTATSLKPRMREHILAECIRVA